MRATLDENRAELETRARDLAAEMEAFRQWPSMEWTDIQARIAYFKTSIKAMEYIASDMEAIASNVNA